MRVIVAINDSHPELLADLENTSDRSRAERMRLLATMGLKFMSMDNNHYNPVRPPSKKTASKPKKSDETPSNDEKIDTGSQTSNESSTKKIANRLVNSLKDL